jgi:hypothetical protein
MLDKRNKGEEKPEITFDDPTFISNPPNGGLLDYITRYNAVRSMNDRGKGTFLINHACFDKFMMVMNVMVNDGMPML